MPVPLFRKELCVERMIFDVSYFYFASDFLQSWWKFVPAQPYKQAEEKKERDIPGLLSICTNQTDLYRTKSVTQKKRAKHVPLTSHAQYMNLSNMLRNAI